MLLEMGRRMGRSPKGRPQGGRGELEEVARVWGRVAPPPLMAGHLKALWAEAQAQVVSFSQKTPL